MQYVSDLGRGQLVELATKSYFGSVDRKDLDDTLDCFHDEALLIVQTSFTVHAGKPAIRRMFEGFFEAYERIVHKDFRCTVDERNGRICARFLVELRDGDGQTTRMENTNFWRVRRDRFQEVYVYMSGGNVLV